MNRLLELSSEKGKGRDTYKLISLSVSLVDEDGWNVSSVLYIDVSFKPLTVYVSVSSRDSLRPGPWMYLPRYNVEKTIFSDV